MNHAVIGEGVATKELDDLVEHMIRRSNDLRESLADGPAASTTSAAIAGELLRCNCIARALVAQVRRAAEPSERRRCVASMLALLAGAMVSDRILENIIAQGRRGTGTVHVVEHRGES
jgi:hypothetical protein